jgi:hypothetical protein
LRAFEQEHEYSKGLLRKAKGLASIRAQLTGTKVQFETFEADDGLGRLDIRHNTPQAPAILSLHRTARDEDSWSAIEFVRRRKSLSLNAVPFVIRK